MLEKLCVTPHEIDIAFIILFAALIAVAVGKGGGKMLLQIVKKLIGHEEVNINVGGGDMSGKPRKECESCSAFTDPNKCPLHAAEHERSMRNEKGITELTADLKLTRTQLFGKLEGIELVLTDIKVAVAKLVVESQYQQKGRGEG